MNSNHCLFQDEPNRIYLISLFNGISTFVDFYNPNLFEEQEWCNLIHRFADTFPNGISPKVNIIARLEFELAYYDVTVQNFIHYSMRTPAT